MAELADRIAMPERKARNQKGAADVVAKREVALAWCRVATAYVATTGGKPWVDAVITHDAIAKNWRVRGGGRGVRMSG